MKQVDWNSILVEGTLEEPYATCGNWEDGTELTEQELEGLPISELYSILYDQKICESEARFEGDS